ncbi:DNA repair protein rhp57 [Friedmanniomyces endolithicus]|uniref:DNA repair protein rhp57 n=1 Tax=Friedmanniomyces endolithicus TaxID=329885 RepID=A0AAN6FHD6_9PEZI|nr:DNA repair protein rhp57 [Friedmanniomyces endolithicus]KAK0286487.1 DNA repair protein rhp57 [Friedmanniomyces endolithicus]KAK0317214.1 DNA repair protein rhp57 [Friedmanniomyces endolithicus]KAK0919857.1 DNA repair protein rhp57 [Friedmanniomyces endolithicus]KAK0971025.1 DNA repair protein rhp57 [Friedmanniomyces endolithicus]
MTNLLSVLPDFDIQPFAHILPSLERALISTADLLTLDALDVAKRAQVPPGEVRRLAVAVVDGVHGSTSLSTGEGVEGGGNGESVEQGGDGSVSNRIEAISTLDDAFDAALCGGIAVGKLTELVGESAAGKTQFLLTLLLSVQLSSTSGTPKSALYISTEAPLSTLRLVQILEEHPKLSALPFDERPTMARVQSAHIHDLEAQDHILRYQVPVVIKRHNVGLLVVDSIAANYRPEFDRGKAKGSAAESFVKRSNQVTELGALLRQIAEKHDIAVVVANQVADRFATVVEPASQIPLSQQHTPKSQPTSPPYPTTTLPATTAHAPKPDSTPIPTLTVSTDDPLSLDHQQRFFTGWGDEPSITNLKTPSLGLAWTNQLGARIALLKSPVYAVRPYASGEEPEIEGWERTCRVVFGEWCGEGRVGFEIWKGGVRAIVGEEPEVKGV